MATPKGRRAGKALAFPELSAREFLAALDAEAAPLGAGWDTFTHEGHARLAVLQAGLGDHAAALDRARGIGTPHRAALALAELAIALPALGDAPLAREALDGALALARGELPPTTRAAVWGQVACALLTHGDTAEAERSYRRALESLDTVNNPGETFRAPARYLLAAGRANEAAELIARRADDLHHLRAFHASYLAFLRDALAAAGCWSGLAAIADGQRDVHARAEYLREVLPAMVAAGRGDDALAVVGRQTAYRMTLTELVLDAAESRGDRGLSERALDEGLRASEEWPADSAASFAHWTVPLDPERARALVAEGHAAFEKETGGEPPSSRTWVLVGLARAEARLGDLDAVRSTLRRIPATDSYTSTAPEEVAKAAERSGHRLVADAMMADLADLARAPGAPPEHVLALTAVARRRERDGVRDEALALLTEARELAKPMGSRGRNTVCSKVAQLQAAAGDYEGAWASAMKVTGKYDGERVWTDVARAAVEAGRFGHAAAALARAEKSAGRPTVSPWLAAVGAFEAFAARGGRPVAVDVF